MLSMRTQEGEAVEEERPLTVQEVASRTRLHPATIYRAIQSGELDAIVVSQSYRLLPRDVADWVERCSTRRLGRYVEDIERAVPFR
jgi:excisionase family DNA binding protein